ncbi:hypothetical protein Tco_0128442 [Tanacetum coccineum]
MLNDKTRVGKSFEKKPKPLNYKLRLLYKHLANANNDLPPPVVLDPSEFMDADEAGFMDADEAAPAPGDEVMDAHGAAPALRDVDMEELMAEHMDEHNMVVQSIVEHDMNEQDMNDSILNDVMNKYVVIICKKLGNSKNIKDDLSGLDKAIGAVLGHRTIECNQLLNTADLSDLLSSRRDRKEEEVALSEECEVKTLAFRAERDLHMTALSLELCCTLISDKRSGPTVGLTALQNFFATLFYSTSMIFDALLVSLLSTAKSSHQSAGIAKQALFSIAQCVAVLCLTTEDYNCSSTREEDRLEW